MLVIQTTTMKTATTTMTRTMTMPVMKISLAKKVGMTTTMMREIPRRTPQLMATAAVMTTTMTTRRVTTTTRAMRTRKTRRKMRRTKINHQRRRESEGSLCRCLVVGVLVNVYLVFGCRCLG